MNNTNIKEGGYTYDTINTCTECGKKIYISTETDIREGILSNSDGFRASTELLITTECICYISNLSDEIRAASTDTYADSGHYNLHEYRIIDNEITRVNKPNVITYTSIFNKSYKTKTEEKTND